MSTRSPAGVSRNETISWSPEFMNRAVAGFGVNVATVDSSGSAGACGIPLRVTKAKFAGSTPALLRQSAFCDTAWFWSTDRLKMASAAHHLVASQELPAGQGIQPGG